MAAELVVLERGVPLAFSFRDLMSYRGAVVTLGVREGFVTEEFLALARAERPSAEQTARLDVLKREMAERVMASPASAVYEPLASG